MSSPAADASVLPSTSIRGSSFQLMLPHVPAQAKTVSVELDGRPASSAPVAGFSLRQLIVTIPAQTDPNAKDFVALGKHSIDVWIDGAWYDTGTSLSVIRAEPGSLLLQQITPAALVPGKGDARLVLTGAGFVRDPASDNVVDWNGVPLPLQWTGCDGPASGDGGPQAEVDSTGTHLTLCHLSTPIGVTTRVQVRQGDKVSNSLMLYRSVWPRRWVLLASVAVNLTGVALILILAAFIRGVRIGRSHYGLFRILFLELDTNTYSLANYQFYVWTGAAIFTYVYLAISRVFVQGMALPDVPSTIPGLVGFGAGTAVGARLVSTFHGSKGGGAESPGIGDFITSGGVAAPDRMQMFLWTNLGAAAFCLTTIRSAPWTIEGLPHLGSGLLSLMGLSTVTYLGGKYARKPGPMLTEISISPGSSAPAPETTKPAPPPPMLSLLPASGSVATSTLSADAVRNAETLIGTGTETMASLGFGGPASAALQALKAAVAAAQAGDTGLPAALATHGLAADSAARAGADEFLASLSSSAPDAERKGQAAELAQRMAAAVQSLEAAARGLPAAQPVSSQPAPPAQPVPRGKSGICAVPVVAPAGSSGRCLTIDLRGRSLSSEATFQINDQELPFRMLAAGNGERIPQIVTPDTNSGLPNMATNLSLTIDIAALVPADREVFLGWFGSSDPLLVRIVNPDGQRSEISVTTPPGTHQALAEDTPAKDTAAA